MENDPILPIMLASSLLGAAVTLVWPRQKPNAPAVVAFLFSLVPLALVFALFARLTDLPGDPWRDNLWHFTCNYSWFPALGLSVSMGLDNISLWLVVLTAFLTPVSILASFNYIKDRRPEFYAWMLVLNTAMLGVFMARDLLLFYLFFEFTLIPMFFIIGIWGGAERRRAAGKFFLFTFSGSILTLASLIYIAYLNSQMPGHGPLTFAMDDLYKWAPKIPTSTQYILFLGLLAGFAVKVPLFPVHTWLPLAHTEAPTAGSVILAGILLKLGTYGLLRFALPVLPAATWHFAPAIAVLCIVGILYGALVSWAQGDMKKLIAYSSVSHLAFCVLGMFALTAEGLSGSVLYMLNHGLSTGALFLVVGMIYERYHTRDMNALSGLARRAPALGFFCVFFVFSSVALPGLNGFVSEFLVLIGTFVSGSTNPNTSRPFGGNLGPAYAIPAATGMILAAVYLLYWTARVVWGPLKEPHQDHSHTAAGAPHHSTTPHSVLSRGGAQSSALIRDLSLREWFILTPIAALILFLGIQPNLVLNSIKRPLTTISANVHQNLPTTQPPTPAPTANQNP
jgi:NADH-quinone oxidoreductase subunit M